MVKEVLIKARSLICNKGWTQHCSARDSARLPVDVLSNEACQFCITGAVERALFDLKAEGYGFMSTLKTLASSSPGVIQNIGLAQYNDGVGRTKQEVLALFDRAIENV